MGGEVSTISKIHHSNILDAPEIGRKQGFEKIL